MTASLPFISWILRYKYFILVPLAIVEGPILMVACGFLIKEGILSLVPTYLLLMGGDLIGDTAWYWVGRLWGMSFVKRFGKYFSIKEKKVLVMEHFFNRYKAYILIISKVTLGFGFALVTLIVAGMSKIPWKYYILFNAIGQIFWTAFLLAVGYGLGNLYDVVAGVFGKVSTIAATIFILVVIFGISKYIGGEIMKKFSNGTA